MSIRSMSQGLSERSMPLLMVHAIVTVTPFKNLSNCTTCWKKKELKQNGTEKRHQVPTEGRKFQ